MKDEIKLFDPKTDKAEFKPPTDYWKWLLNTPVRGSKIMEEYWGERCPDYEPECWACRAWRHYDETGEVMK